MPHQQLKAFFLLPGMVSIVIPFVLLVITRNLHPWWTLPLFLAITAFVSSILIMMAGMYLMATTIRLFSRRGQGTLAPWNPPVHFVVEGMYRHVRNPMITGVFFILLGESVFFGSLAIFILFCVFVLLNCIYIPLKEEPGLRKRFGNEYIEYTKHVPRWIPHLKQWIPDPGNDASNP